jgi:predicted ATPase
MRLLRVQVPNFRVLKNVDISFEKEFIPSIFPIGSQNGGGKSTLLQLIFVLLHCSTHADRTEFLQNMLHGFTINDDSDNRILAIIDIWDGEKIVKLKFLSCKNSYIKNILGESYINENQENPYLDFSRLQLVDNTPMRIKLELEREKLDKFINQIKQIKEIKFDNQRLPHIKEIIKLINAEFEIGIKEEFNNLSNLLIMDAILERYQADISKKISKIESKLKSFNGELLELERILQNLQSEKLLYICNYFVNSDGVDEAILLCHIENLEMDKANDFFQELSQKIFLAAPSTQVFLFFPQESRKLLFREKEEANDYYSLIRTAKYRLTGLFMYDFLAVDLLIEAFKASRDKDFREAIKKGEYGNSYKELMTDLDAILLNKTIKLDDDFAGITFQLNKDGENIELYPEDLSHGELKRLSIYMWIKYHNIEDAIVLMDEIEIAFHPDWQYQIIADLQQWSTSNQYILATHSYELCQALTPSHVKELEPKLLR